MNLGEFALTFAPGNLGAPPAGRLTRQAVLRCAGPRLNLGRLTAGKSAVPTDATNMARLDDADRMAFAR